MRSWLSLLLLSLTWPAVASRAEPLPREAATGGVEQSLRQEAEAAIDRAVTYLKTHQRPDGSWSNRQYPALTALPIWALAVHGRLDEATRERGVKFLLDHAHENGAIFADPEEDRKGGGLPTYNTAISMVALHLSGAPGVTPTVLKARRFVASSQHLGGDIYHGGFGYDSTTKRAYADLSNTVIALEALALTRSVEDQRPAGEPKVEIDRAAAVDFIQRTQNRPESNPSPSVSDDPKDRGGFFYQPDKTMSASTTNAAGVVKFSSYGSMTYAGLLSFIYADVSPQDPRVRSAYDWAIRHWTLEENPGMGAEGQFYFYNTLSKGMNIMGQDLIPRPDGSTLHWRREVVKKLINLQQMDPDGTGHWRNRTSRWMEGDPILVTSYSLIALQNALR
jgi:squalene-hopene/tetraprenyl-beta-curcumene cyclase